MNKMKKVRKREESVRTKAECKSSLDIVFGCDDLLREIFKYLPTLKGANLVSKQFYRVASELSQGKAWMWIQNEEFIDDESLFQSMINTKRTINNFAIGESSAISPVSYYDESDDFLCEKWYFHAVDTIVGIHHGWNVKCLQLMNIDISMYNLLSLLSMCPTVKVLKLFFVNQKFSKIPSKRLKYTNASLPTITDVIMYECGSMVDWLVKYLPPNTIKSLTVKSLTLDNLAAVLKSQTNIVKFSLASDMDESLPFDLLDPVKLTHLTLYVKNQQNITGIIEKQTNLKYLDISQMAINDDTFEAVTKLSNLQKLDINVADITFVDFILISQLKALRCLTISSASSNHLEVLLYLKNSKLEEFHCTDDGCDMSLIEAIEKKILSSRNFSTV